MTIQELFNLGSAIMIALIGWFAREMWQTVKEVTKDLSRLREDLPKSYVPKEDWKDGMNEIKDMLGQIFNRLDGKADK
jgi:hypothetical protein